MPKTQGSTFSSRTTVEEIPYIMLQKIGDYILYVMNSGLAPATIRQQLE